MAYIIIRDEGNLGPFDEQEVAEFVCNGLVLTREKCYDTLHPGSITTVGEVLHSKGFSTRVQQSGSFLNQLKTIGGNLLLPKAVFSSEPWKRDRRLLLMAVVGLSLSVLINISGILPDLVIFYVVSLYFAIIWGLFFYYLFCTEQVRLKPTIITIFFTQITTVILFSIVGVGGLTGLIGYNILGCTIGIGVPEEFTKLLIILIILSRSKEILTPDTVVYYGLMSGIAFGVFEGVQYQTTVNYALLLEGGTSSTVYTQSFLMNIIRLTSLPFLHAVWCGIGSYYAACSWIFPHYRNTLITLAILIPALLHGLYDYLVFNGMSVLSIAVVFLSVVLLMVYLASHYKLVQKIR
jgi:RsiW-degrading membrane proteinase PrsW (M82 family)